MYRDDVIEVWNLTPGGPAHRESQEIFNVVGRVANPEQVEQFSYRLNGGAETPIVFRRSADYDDGRLFRQGDFNIDTIRSPELRAENRITLKLRIGSEEVVRDIEFRCAEPSRPEPRFHLDLEDVSSTEEVGQVIDGNWRVGVDQVGKPCVEIRKEDAGYDRILLFGRGEWTTGYEVTARLAPTAWTSKYHNLGLVFKWNPHSQGNGLVLPTRWNTGLGYYCSYSPGLRLRFGTDVHVDDRGTKVGDHVLAEAHYSRWRRWCYRVINEKGRRRLPISQLPAGRQFRFRLIVDPSRYALTVWRVDRPEPPPQLVTERVDERLSQGAVGVIALCCAVRVYEFDVAPTRGPSPSTD